jgi:hypothetical protein
VTLRRTAPARAAHERPVSVDHPSGAPCSRPDKQARFKEKEGEPPVPVAQTYVVDNTAATVGAIVSLGVLVLWIIVIVKFFQIAGDVRFIKDLLQFQDEYKDDEEDKDAFLTSAARLRELGQLRADGILSEDEFVGMKAAMLQDSDVLSTPDGRDDLHPGQGDGA